MMTTNGNTPCYIYEENEILESCRKLKNSLPGFGFLYSIKTNPFVPIIRRVKEEGFGSDAASVREVEKSLAVGMKPEEIFFSAPGRTERDMKQVWGKCILVADSLHEISLMQKIAEKNKETAKIGIRLHPDFTMGGVPRGSSKFGIDMGSAKEEEELKTLLKHCPNLQVIGIHIHLKSQELDTAALGQYYLDVFDYVLRMKDALEIEPRFINFGSGIGIAYDENYDQPIDMKKLAEFTTRLREKNENTLKAKLLIETGRFVVCKAGRYLVEVVDKKESNGVTYLVVQGGLNGFLRPGMLEFVKMIAGAEEAEKISGLEPLYTSAHEYRIRVIGRGEEKTEDKKKNAAETAEHKEMETVTIAGSLCTSLDVLGRDIHMERAEIGDIIEFSNAGAYGYSLSALDFAGFSRPTQYLHTISDEWVKE